jgi:hypothetical protein
VVNKKVVINMPNENERPWYRSPAIMGLVIAAIIGAVGAIIAAYIGIIPFMGPELATVQGIVTDNAGNPVIGAVVEIDGSSVTTGSDGRYVIHGVPINTKTITVRAPGAEVVKRPLRISKGAETIMYDITLPSPVRPPPMLTISPTPTPEIRFTYPNEEDKFPLATGHTVEGTASNVPDDLSLWIVTVAPDNMRYPNTPVVIYKDTWSAKIWIGRTPENIGEMFYIYAILADEKADKELQDYMDECRRKGSWPGLHSLPKGAKVYAKVMVIGM